MERVGVNILLNTGPKIIRCAARIHWDMSRWIRVVIRKHGWFGWALPLFLVVFAATLLFEYDLYRVENKLNYKISELKLEVERASALANTSDGDEAQVGEKRLKYFGDILVQYEDIPAVLQSILQTGKDHQLKLTRGDYKPQVDIYGKFLRYRINFPVKGNQEAIFGFLLKVLQMHQTLTIESISLRREQSDSVEIEAMIRMVLFTRMAENVGMPVDRNKIKEGR